MKPILETNRLIMRNFTTKDCNELLEIFSDGGMPHLEIFGPLDSEYSLGFINRMTESYKNNGYGLWAIVEKNENKLIGYCGIHKILINDGEEKTEIAYRIHKKLWGMGFATEAAKAVLDYAFRGLNLDEVVACILETNTKSINVAQKIGLKYTRDCTFRGTKCHLYSKRNSLK